MATYIETPKKKCEICLKEFSRRPRCGLRIWETAEFCSRECRNKRTFPPESRIRMTDALVKNRMDRTGMKPWNWIENRSLIKIGDRSFHDPRYKQWHKAVKDRDGWKCKISNMDCSEKLEAHHILSWSKFPELRYEINNGITLCHFHHPRKRVDEIKLSNFFQSLVVA